MANDSFMIFTGTANTRLAVDVVNHLDMSLGKMTVGRFSDGEVMVEINENVRGKDVFVLQPTCAPTNDNLMEIMVMVDALRRASAGRIRSEEHTSELQSLMRISYAVFCLKKKTQYSNTNIRIQTYTD